MPKKHLGTCQLCSRTNEGRMPVRYNGKLILICSHHGASTDAVYDVMNDKRRARVHALLNGKYSVSYMQTWPVGGYHSISGGRTKFSNLETAKRYCDEHVKDPAARALGSKGGSSTSDAKKKAARENGKKGGRPIHRISPVNQMKTL